MVAKTKEVWKSKETWRAKIDSFEAAMHDRMSRVQLSAAPNGGEESHDNLQNRHGEPPLATPAMLRNPPAARHCRNCQPQEAESANAHVVEDVVTTYSEAAHSKPTPVYAIIAVLGALAATAAGVMGRYVYKRRTRIQVPALIDMADNWAMAATSSGIPQGVIDKALKVNLDMSTYGTIAEIGAGTEVGRIFFYVGASAGTIAKTVCAYDMKVSDSIYGECDRFVTQERLEQMLDTEYEELEETLRVHRPKTKFFAFADTVVAKKWGQDNECHGWMGMKFQLDPEAAPVRCLVHCRLLDPTMQDQQGALGALGTNLIHACFYELDGIMKPVAGGADYSSFLKSLKDDLQGRVEVDLVKFEGKGMENVSPYIIGTELVRQGLVSAVTFDRAGEITVPTDMIRKHSILVSRSMPKDLVEAALVKVPKSDEAKGVIHLTELTLAGLTNSESPNYTADLSKFDALHGSPAIISNFPNYIQLTKYLSRNTNESIVTLVDSVGMQALFKEEQYMSLEGGILEFFGCVVRSGLTMLVSPNVEDVFVDPELQLLFKFMVENGIIRSLTE
uniref:Uncharacterized protein n=1 Tax=Eutreptiella gymnastica TaxID=73025 RepID=A0A7S1HSB6_9EUGL